MQGTSLREADTVLKKCLAERQMALDTHHEADKDKVGLTAELKCAELDKSLALAQSKAEEVPALREKTEQLQG